MVHWPRWLPCPYMVKTFKNLPLPNQISPGTELYQNCWNDGPMLTFDLLWQGQICFPMHLYGPYTFIWEKCWEFIFWTSIIHLNPNLMMSIRALSKHKIAKWAYKKSKMATTAAILKINFRHLFPNLWSLWAETCSVATGWLLDWNKLKLYRSEIQDGRNDSAALYKVAARAKNRNYSNDILSLANDLISVYLHISLPPMALYQNIAKMVIWVCIVCSCLSDQIHTVKYNMVRVMLRQTGIIMTKSSVITNRLSITMAVLIIDYLFSSD